MCQDAPMLHDSDIVVISLASSFPASLYLSPKSARQFDKNALVLGDEMQKYLRRDFSSCCDIKMANSSIFFTKSIANADIVHKWKNASLW